MYTSKIERVTSVFSKYPSEGVERTQKVDDKETVKMRADINNVEKKHEIKRLKKVKLLL